MTSTTPTETMIAGDGEPHGRVPLPKLKFSGSDRFLRELRKRVDAYFDRTGRSRRDCPQMYFKTATIMAWFATAYVLLLFVAHSWWLALPLAVVLGLAMAAIGFNIQHDGGHRAYSDRRWINKIMALSLDLMGGSSYLWDWKHNSIHHTYPNVNGHDDDINLGFLGRLSPQQPRFWFHRLQGIYLWLLYGFLAIKWHLVDDFYQVSTGYIGGHKIPRPKGKDLVVFIAGKVCFFSLAFVIPMLLHPWWAVLSVYAIAAFVSGVVLSVVFQLAHCVGEAEFPVPTVEEGGAQRIQTEWAVHQVQTTVDFARGNPVLCWFLGGLNFQIEHHLFHKICHVHYPALSKVVEEACREFGVQYNSHKSFFSAVSSHFHWLVEMGRRPVNLTPQIPAA
ncbi:MAG TPA: acyl-CoA desaturase [Tepidisphaeraceae bacterium]|jgi:linoleoyl-CoA desaturase|nr:acyl-CoA desaturase [Tepidisphaeraceae bacterium]